MATRLGFSTHWAERIGEKAGERNYFPEKVIWGLRISENEKFTLAHELMNKSDYSPKLLHILGKTKTQTIRKNYDFWKSKEGKMIQPFIWAGKPYRSKHVVFCPEVRLKRVIKVRVVKSPRGERYVNIENNEWRSGYSVVRNENLDLFAKADGFDSVEDFFAWFNEDFEGALLEWE